MAVLGNIGQDSEARFVPYTAGGELPGDRSGEAEEAKSEALKEVRPPSGEEKELAAIGEGDENAEEQPVGDARSELAKSEQNMPNEEQKADLSAFPKPKMTKMQSTP